MSFWRRLFSSARSPRADPSLRLRLTRLRRLHRCYREFLGLFVDAAEKQGEGYILDRQYVVALAEKAYRLGYEILFHGHALCPGGALGDYATLDRLKMLTREVLGSKGAPGDSPSADTSAPASEISPRQLREAREHRVKLIDNAGDVACPGVGWGQVWSVQSDADLLGLPGHAVLVALRLEETPTLLRTLPRMAAILVEQATPGDRIAALARSFRVPTLLGVTGVTTRLSPGELITVDATDAIVYSGFFEELVYHHTLHGSRSEEPEYHLLNLVLRELGSPLPAGALLGEAAGARQTLCDTVEGAYGTTLYRLAVDLWPRGGVCAAGSSGLSEDIRTVNFSAPAPEAEPAAPEVFASPDPSAWVLAGLGGSEGGGTAAPPGDARGLLCVSEESVTALLAAGNRVVALDTVAIGGAEGNHAMVSASEASGRGGTEGEGLDRLYAEALRLGLVVVRTPRAVTAWHERIPPGSVRETLTRVGGLARRATLNTWGTQWKTGRG